MPIRFPCANPQCGFELVISARAGASEVRCPNCGLVQAAPKVEVPAPPRDAPASPPGAAPAGRRRGREDLLEEEPARDLGLVGDALRSILFAIRSLPRMLLLILVLLGGKTLYDTCFGGLAFILSTMCFLPILAPLVAGVAWYAMIGFVLRYYLDVSLAALERVGAAPSVPRLGLGALFEYGMTGLAVLVLYVLPVVTLPLLPLGLLALAWSDDARGLDVLWAFQAARRFPGALGRLWAVLALWCGVLAAAAGVLSWGVGAATARLIHASGGRTGGLILASAVAVLGALAMALVACVLLFVLFRCAGLLGRHCPEVLETLPEKPPSHWVLGGMVLAGIVLSFHAQYWLWVLLRSV